MNDAGVVKVAEDARSRRRRLTAMTLGLSALCMWPLSIVTCGFASGAAVVCGLVGVVVYPRSLLSWLGLIFNAAFLGLVLWYDPYILSDAWRGGDGMRAAARREAWESLYRDLTGAGVEADVRGLPSNVSGLRVRRELRDGDAVLWEIRDGAGVSLAGSGAEVRRRVSQIIESRGATAPATAELVIICSTRDLRIQSRDNAYWLMTCSPGAEEGLLRYVEAELPPVPGCLYSQCDEMDPKTGRAAGKITYPETARRFFRMYYPDLASKLEARSYEARFTE